MALNFSIMVVDVAKLIVTLYEHLQHLPHNRPASYMKCRCVRYAIIPPIQLVEQQSDFPSEHSQSFHLR